MKAEHKLYAAVCVVVGLGIAFWQVSESKERDAQAHSPAAASDLPTFKLTKEDAEKVTKFVINNKDKGEVTLEKKGDKWQVTAPLTADADPAAIKSIVENLEKIEVKSLIADTPDVHGKYELAGDKAVHAQAFKGDEVVFDLYFGMRGSRGQMARQGGKDVSAAVYVVDGYSSYNWAKELKGWRVKEMLKFEDGNVIAAEVDNSHGKFSFTKDGEGWKGKFYKRDDKGKLAGKSKDIDEFDENKVKDFLRAYKNLKATDFAAKDADTGVSDPMANGGTVRFTLKDEDKPSQIIHVGGTQEGSNRYAIKPGDETVYVISSWSSDWATAELPKFQATKDEEGAGAPPGAKLPNLPGLPGGPPKVPAG